MEKLKLEDIFIKIPHKINEGLGLFLAVDFGNLLEENFDFSVYLPKYKQNLQRDYVWTNEQKSEFLKSCIKGITSGMTPFCLIEDKIKGCKMVIDGKQRLLTFIGLLKGKVYIENNGKKYFWNDLSNEVKYKISWHGIKTNLGYQYDGWTDEDKLNWFKQINFCGTNLDKKHLEKFIIN